MEEAACAWCDAADAGGEAGKRPSSTSTAVAERSSTRSPRFPGPNDYAIVAPMAQQRETTDTVGPCEAGRMYIYPQLLATQHSSVLSLQALHLVSFGLAVKLAPMPPQPTVAPVPSR